MADYLFRNVDILDLKPSTGVGIKIPFDGATGINTTFTTQDAIKSNLLNFLLTGKRERVLNPGFGSGLRELMFQPLTDDLRGDMENLIIGGVNEFFPNVQINDLTIDFVQEESKVIINLNYSVINTNIEDEIQININNGGV
tara:strand:+ start:6969 stop:7391 length:423 start_codon:yes stop_codon:yes gene_type:complete